MIEIIDNAGTKSYGCCHSMKQAQNILVYLKDSGRIPDTEESVTVCHYTSGKLQGVSEVEFRNGKWRRVTNASKREEIPAGLSPAVS